MPPKGLPDPADGPKPPRKRSKFKIIMLIGSLSLLLGVGAGAGYWWLFKRPNATGFSGLMNVFSSSSATQEAPAGEQAGTPPRAQNSEKDAAPEKGAQTRALIRPVPLPEITVNLADLPGDRYLKIAMEVEVNAQDAEKELQNQNARVRDAIILLLSSKSVRDLTTPEGKVLLKNEVASRLNQILGAPRIVRVFFTNFVIQ